MNRQAVDLLDARSQRNLPHRPTIPQPGGPLPHRRPPTTPAPRPAHCASWS